MSESCQFQPGFPIRIQTQDDAELISSLFFLRCRRARKLTGSAANPERKTSDDASGQRNLAGPGILPSMPQFFRSPLVSFSTTPRSICCGPGQNQWGRDFLEKNCTFRAEVFPVSGGHFQFLQQTEFVNPDGNFSEQLLAKFNKPAIHVRCRSALKFYF